jgi:hypothetical protein
MNNLTGLYFRYIKSTNRGETKTVFSGVIRAQLASDNYLIEYVHNPGIMRIEWIGNMGKGNWEFSSSGF